jgi:ketosteroid isomerase-like protein
MFGPQSVTDIDILDHGSSGDIGFWTGIQRATVEPVAMTLRISAVFRCQEGEWRMVHRHASMAMDEGKPS